MVFDLNRTLELIQGGLLQSERTWAEYAKQRAPWLDTAINLTLPAIVVSAVLAGLLGWLFGDSYLLGSSRTGVGGVIGNMVMYCLSVLLMAGLATAFARMFQGDTPAAATVAADTPAADTMTIDEAAAPESVAQAAAEPTFDQGFAAVSFAVLAGLAGNVLGTIPYLGFLLALAAFIYSLVLMYRAFPVFLGVAVDDRVKHFIATILTGIVGMLILGAVFGGLFASGNSAEDRAEDVLEQWQERLDSGSTGSSRGFDSTDTNTDDGGDTEPDFLGIGRQSKYVEDATDDSFDAPSDGQVTDSQVKLLIRVLQRTKEMRDDSQARLKKIADKTDGDETPSLGDLFGGLRSVMDVGTAEMQVVKSAGANWAEHQWVKEALYEARLQKDLNDRIKANYAMYEKYAEELEELL